MAIETVAQVLGEDHDLAQPRVDQVGEHQVDQPVLTAERHRRFGAFLGQRQQPPAFATGQHHAEHVLAVGHGQSFYPCWLPSSRCQALIATSK